MSQSTSPFFISVKTSTPKFSIFFGTNVGGAIILNLAPNLDKSKILTFDSYENFLSLSDK